VTMTLTELRGAYEGPVGRIEYRGQRNCSHSLTLLDYSTRSFVVRQTLDSGDCVDGNQVRFELTDPEGLAGEWLYPDGKSWMRTTLLRVTKPVDDLKEPEVARQTTTDSAPPPAVETTGQVEWGGLTRDEVGRGPRMRGADGQADALFRLILSRSDRVVSRIVLRRPKTRQVWRSYENPYGNWVLGVFVNDRRVLPDPSGNLWIHLSGIDEISLFASNDAVYSRWFDRGQRYEVEVSYQNIARPDTLRLVIP
jgi:hypothetical protein